MVDRVLPGERAAASEADAERLIGLWRLLSFREQASDGSWTDAMGPDPSGYIGYWPQGHMSVLIGSARRPRFNGAWAAIAAEEKARALDGLVAYAGRYRYEPGRIVHEVEVCWIPNWQGRELVRIPTFLDDDRLLLRTPDTGAAGRSRPQEVEWQRVS